MMPIKKLRATITDVKDLSPTAREVTLKLPEPIFIIAGAFVNVFIKHEGEVLRRAFSISSRDGETDTFTLSIRLKPTGAVTPLFWRDDIVGTEVEIMGPLGLNTADKMSSDKIFLFGFGVGAGVVKSLAEHFVDRNNLASLTIVTGNRSEAELLHKDFFDNLDSAYSKATVDYVVSSPEPSSPYKQGYIQDHLDDYDFNNSCVYVCGQEAACDALVETVKAQQPVECNFFVEGFH